MKTTNMNNANAAIENAVSEFIYVATRVRTEVWEERTEMDISAFECTDMTAISACLLTSWIDVILSEEESAP